MIFIYCYIVFLDYDFSGKKNIMKNENVVSILLDYQPNDKKYIFQFFNFNVTKRNYHFYDFI